MNQSQHNPDVVQSDVIDSVDRMVGLAYHVAADLQDLHGVKSVVQCRETYNLVVTAHDDYALLSNLQTVCAWNQAEFSIESAGRLDGDMVVRFNLHG